MNRLIALLGSQLGSAKPLHDLLGWILTVLLTVAGLLVTAADWLTGSTCFAMAIAVCPRTEAPAWVRLLFLLISVFLLS